MGASVRRQTRGSCCCDVAPEVRGSGGHETGGHWFMSHYGWVHV